MSALQWCCRSARKGSKRASSSSQPWVFASNGPGKPELKPICSGAAFNRGAVISDFQRAPAHVKHVVDAEGNGDCQRQFKLFVFSSQIGFAPSYPPLARGGQGIIRDNVILYLQASFQSEMPHSSDVSWGRVKVLDKRTPETGISASCKDVSSLFLSLTPWSHGYRKCITVARECREPKPKLSSVWR